VELEQLATDNRQLKRGWGGAQWAVGSD